MNISLNESQRSEYVPPKSKKGKLEIPDYNSELAQLGDSSQSPAGMKVTSVAETPEHAIIVQKRKAKKDGNAGSDKTLVNGPKKPDDLQVLTQVNSSKPSSNEVVDFGDKCQSTCFLKQWTGPWPSYHKSTKQILHMAKMRRKCFLNGIQNVS